MFWRKGMLVTLNNGKAYYFSMKDAEKAKMELDGFLVAESSENSPSVAA
jgi:hypothetical protein